MNPIYTVRGASGCFVGTFQAKNAKQAIARAVAGQVATASVFRTHSLPRDMANWTASVEPMIVFNIHAARAARKLTTQEIPT